MDSDRPPADPTTDGTHHADAPSGPAAPSVGIFWGIPEGGRLVLVVDRTTLAEAEAYGDCLTHPRGHHEVWQAWRARGATALARAGLPTVIAGHPYEHFPRGRIVYMRTPALFTLYADRRLQRPGTIAELIALFGLAGQRHVVRSDGHYRSLA